MFFGSYTYKVDAKGRVSVPAEYRDAIAGEPFHGVVCYPSFTEPALDGGGASLMDNFQSLIERLDPYGEDRDAFELAVMAEARRIPMDGDGRIVLPAEFIEFAGLEGRARFIGRGNRFQIWKPEAHDEVRELARAKARERRGLLRSVHSQSREAAE